MASHADIRNLVHRHGDKDDVRLPAFLQPMDAPYCVVTNQRGTKVIAKKQWRIPLSVPCEEKKKALRMYAEFYNKFLLNFGSGTNRVKAKAMHFAYQTAFSEESRKLIEKWVTAPQEGIYRTFRTKERADELFELHHYFTEAYPQESDASIQAMIGAEECSLLLNNRGGVRQLLQNQLKPGVIHGEYRAYSRKEQEIIHSIYRGNADAENLYDIIHSRLENRSRNSIMRQIEFLLAREVNRDITMVGSWTSDDRFKSQTPALSSNELQELKELHGYFAGDWPRITFEMPGGYTQVQLEKVFREQNLFRRKISPWSRAERTRLPASFKKHDGNFKNMRQDFPGRSVYGIMNLYNLVVKERAERIQAEKARRTIQKPVRHRSQYNPYAF